jgi:lysophospholipase L1-like esterase
MLNLKEKFLEKGETLICLGDSITYAPNGYVSVLQEKLHDNTIINAGVPGEKTANALVRFKTDVLDRKPDALSIFFGANDAAVGRREWGDEPTLSPEAYYSNIVWMIHIARLNGVKKFSVTAPFPEYEGEEELSKFGNILQSYCLAARRAADEMHTYFVALDTLFINEWRKHPGHTGLLLTGDGIHPTVESHRQIADKFLKDWNM